MSYIIVPAGSTVRISFQLNIDLLLFFFLISCGKVSSISFIFLKNGFMALSTSSTVALFLVLPPSPGVWEGMGRHNWHVTTILFRKFEFKKKKNFVFKICVCSLFGFIFIYFFNQLLASELPSGLLGHRGIPCWVCPWKCALTLTHNPDGKYSPCYSVLSIFKFLLSFLISPTCC